MSKINNYINSFLSTDNPVLNRITSEYKTRTDVSPCIGLQIGRYLSWLIELTNAKRVVEFGTCLGYSTVVLAEAVRKNNGMLTAIESSKNHVKETSRNIKEAKLEKYVKLINGNAKTEFEKCDGVFDFILQDSLKAIYPNMLNICIEKIKPGGIIVADDTLFKPMEIKEKFSNFMHKYNELVFSNQKLFSTILPIGNGLTISIKK